MTAKITTTVYKWDNGKVVEVDSRNKNDMQNIVSDEKRKENYEKNRGASINQKRSQ